MANSRSLGFVDKCMVAAMAAMNSSYMSENGNTGKTANAAIETEKIKTLGEYYNDNFMGQGKYIADIDNQKLMRTYVVPLVLPTGEKVDLIINSKGQDMACVFPNASSSKEQFSLTPRMEKEIENTLRTKGIDGLTMSSSVLLKLDDLVKPETMTEFTKSVEEDNLVPDTPRKTIAKVKEKEEKSDIQVDGDDQLYDIAGKDGMSPAEIQEEISKEEQRLTAIAESAGMSLDELKKFCLENKLTSDAIKGVAVVNDPAQLSPFLDGMELGNESGKVVVIKTEENGMQTRARVASQSGKTLVDNPKYDDRMASLVKESGETQTVENVEEHTNEVDTDREVQYVDENGVQRNEVVEGSAAEAAIFEERFAKLKDEYKEKLNAINSQEMEPEDRTQAIENLACEFYANTCQIERECGVNAISITKEALAEAEYRVEENQKTQVVEGTKDALKFAAGVGLGVMTAAVDMFEEYDEMGKPIVPGKRTH